jgi:hypothetical protein
LPGLSHHSFYTSSEEPPLSIFNSYRDIPSGDIVGSYFNKSRSQAEAILVRAGQVIYLNEHFSNAGEYLAVTGSITDSGVVLARAYTTSSPLHTRDLLLVPALTTPAIVNVTINGRFVSVSWQPVHGATEYIVEAGSSPGQSNFFNNSVGSQLSVGGAVPPGRYYVRVRARNQLRVGAASEELILNVP